MLDAYMSATSPSFFWSTIPSLGALGVKVPVEQFDFIFDGQMLTDLL